MYSIRYTRQSAVAYLLYVIINLNTASFLVMDGQVLFLIWSLFLSVCYRHGYKIISKLQTFMAFSENLNFKIVGSLLVITSLRRAVTLYD